jgi:hypothetical protein
MDVNPVPLSGTNYSSSDTFQLFDVTTGQLAHISQGSALGTQTFTDAIDQITVSFTLATISNGEIQISGNGFTGTTDVNYAVFNGATVGTAGGSLANGGEYKLVADGANAFKLYDGSTQLILTNPTGPQRQRHRRPQLLCLLGLRAEPGRQRLGVVRARRDQLDQQHDLHSRQFAGEWRHRDLPGRD